MSDPDTGTDTAAGVLSQEPLLDQTCPELDRTIAALAAARGHCSAKLNHGFWERLVRLDRLGFDFRDPACDGAAADHALGIKGSAFCEGGFLAELLALMADMPAPETGFDFCASLSPWPGSREIEGTPITGRGACAEMIRSIVPRPHLDNAAQAGLTGHGWKRAMLTGRLAEVTEVLAQGQVILVRNSDMRAFGDMIAPRRLEFVEIDARTARASRQDVLRAVLSRMAAAEGQPRVLLQAGGSLSTWLLIQMARTFPDAVALDLGQAMSLCNPARAIRANWLRVYPVTAFRGTEAQHPGWLRAPAVGGAADPMQSLLSPLLRDTGLVRLAQAHGVASPRGWQDAALPQTVGGAVPFIENKSPQPVRLAQVMALSQRANRHANGGPVVGLLEAAIARLTCSGSQREAVVVASATVGLQLACAAAALARDGQPMHWVTPAQGFFSVATGPLGHTAVMDCTPEGGLDLAALQALPQADWDGLILTNLFAGQSDWAEARALCDRHGKALVIDNALGLLDRDPSADASGDVEVISLHHTKPWGYGEGGVVLAPPKVARVIRALANFGAGLGPAARRFATNGKLSDLAAAAILERLERLPNWSVLYHMQYRRIASVVQEYDLPLHVPAAPRSPPAFVPLRAAQPVPETALIQPQVHFRKYYRPLGAADATPNAHRFFDHVLCCPCNPHLRSIFDATLARALARAAGLPDIAVHRASEQDL